MLEKFSEKNSRLYCIGRSAGMLMRMNETTYPGRRVRGVEAELVHDPAGLDAVGGPPAVEDERLAHADDGAAAAHLAVLARGLPVARLGGAVRARPRRVLAVPEAEEVPLARRQLGRVW